MTAKLQPPAPGLGIKPGDILYILFKHKWKILIVSALGVVGFFLAPFVFPAPYVSEAKLLIRYVVEGKNPTQVDDSRVKSPDSRGEGVMQAELDILTSRDVVAQAVTNIGPNKILGGHGGANDLDQAIGVVRQGLLADAGRRGSVLRVTFAHTNPEIVQPVLAQIVSTYLKQHSEIHKGGALDKFLTAEIESLKSKLSNTEGELRRIKKNANVMSLEETKKAYADQIARFRQEIFSAEAELAERQASVTEMARVLNLPLPFGVTNSSTDVVAGISITNPVVASTQTTQAVAAVKDHQAVAPEKILAYRKICSLVDTYTKREQELLLQFTPENSRVKSAQEQLAGAEKQKLQMEAENPGLLAVQVSTSKSSEVDPAAKSREAFMTESARVLAILSKLKILNEQLDKVRKEADGVYDAEGEITKLQMERDQQEAKYKAIYASQEQAQSNENGKVSNISTIQTPTPAARDSAKLDKIRYGLLAGGFMAAIALAFLLELYLDPSIKRASDIEVGIGLPLFISIPAFKLNGSGKHLTNGKSTKLLGAPSNAGAASDSKSQAVVSTSGSAPLSAAEVVPWDPSHQLRPFSEALRDRLITFFEVNNMTHKPKLVAITSCSEGAGVSTIAAGLAASLSETGEGNVLLVDMNSQEGAAHQFHKGDLAYDIDFALTMEKRDGAKVQDNLFVVSEDSNCDKIPSALPRRFKNLVPKLKASDYDYIIFDMPPVSQVSLTPRLARFMDMTLMVAEAEKTSKDVIRKAGNMIAEARSNVGVVLNKSKTYVPKSLVQEL